MGEVPVAGHPGRAEPLVLAGPMLCWSSGHAIHNGKGSLHADG